MRIELLDYDSMVSLSTWMQDDKGVCDYNATAYVNAPTLEKTSRDCMPTLGSLGFQKKTLICADSIQAQDIKLNWEMESAKGI